MTPHRPGALTAEDIVALHALMIQQYGGDYSPRDPDATCAERSLQAALMAASYQSADGKNLDSLHVASALLFYLAKNHCFTDGNKRVAWAAAIECLLRDGLEVKASTDEAAEFVLRVADGHHSREQVLDWFAANGRLSAYQAE